MKIVVFGATGMVGSAVMDEGRSRGHEMVAVSTREGAGDVVASIEDLEAVRRVSEGADAIVVSVPPARSTSAETWLDAMRALADEPLKPRLLMVGGAGSTLDADGKLVLESPDFPQAIKGEATAANAALGIFRDGQPKPTWTIVSPAPVLSPGERTGRYRTSDDSVIGGSVSSQDLAVAMMDELENGTHLNKRFVVAN